MIERTYLSKFSTIVKGSNINTVLTLLLNWFMVVIHQGFYAILTIIKLRIWLTMAFSLTLIN